jgi:hypothetical protein
MIELNKMVLIKLLQGDISPELIDKPEPVLHRILFFDLLYGLFVFDKLIDQLGKGDS